MARPIININGSEYRELMKQRYLKKEYKRYYPHMKWALETLDKLERKASQGRLTYEDYATFDKAKVIINFVAEEKREERTTTHYIWRTRRDGKVRPSHAANNGETFAWDSPPPTGHPGEDFGCRCWAEPYELEAEDLQEYVNQTVTSSAGDTSSAWTRDDFINHYNHGRGEMVRLSEIGHLQNVIDHAKDVLFGRVEDQIFEEVRQNGGDNFSYHFRNSYEFEPVIFEIGGATIAGSGLVDVVDKKKFWMITADLNYAFSDFFNDPYDYFDIFPWDINTGTPYHITDGWDTRLEAIIKK